MRSESEREALQTSRAALARALRTHRDAEIRNGARLISCDERHTGAMCDVISALLGAFGDRKVFMIIEPEIARLGRHSRPEDIVAWIEGVGIFVLEIKSHEISRIQGFENSAPQVIYNGHPSADRDLLDQPRSLAHDLRSEIETSFQGHEEQLPALYFAGWLPRVSLADVQQRGSDVAPDKVWLSDMLERDRFLGRLGVMRNLTRGRGADRDHLPTFANSFGCTSGLRSTDRRPTATPGTLGQAIHDREHLLKRLTREQEALAFSPTLVRGPKVVRGVVGSGKTIVLANAVAQRYLRFFSRSEQQDLSQAGTAAPRILVLCFNVPLVEHIRDLIDQCFEQRKTRDAWSIPRDSLTVVNIDALASRLRSAHLDYKSKPIKERVADLLQHGFEGQGSYDHIFVDEAQDLTLDWYPLIRELARSAPEGPSIVVFYDDAQNVYGRKRPGSAENVPTWTDLLGASPNPRGLRTVMRIGHRNTNEILTFSFNMLLGSFAERDLQMATFTDLNQYQSELIPHDPGLNHPRSGKPCVEQIAPRQYRINFAVHTGPLPSIHKIPHEQELLEKLARRIQSDIQKGGASASDILVMTREKKSVFKIFRSLEASGVRCHSPVNADCTSDDPRGARLSIKDLAQTDFRKQPFFQEGCVTVSTIKSAKGYTAHLGHLVFVEELEKGGSSLSSQQRARAELHVGCTRVTLCLDLWAKGGSLINEAADVLNALGS